MGNVEGVLAAICCVAGSFIGLALVVYIAVTVAKWAWVG